MVEKLVFVTVLTVLTGCTTDTLFVGTHTRVGIDASMDGMGGGIGVKNAAMTIAPTKENGQAYDVLGTTDIDLSFLDLVMSETVATGVAAVCASSKFKHANFTDRVKQADPLIFAAATSWSLLEVNMGEAVGPAISFGYRRTVGIRMPIKDENIGSAYASVSISTIGKDHPNGAAKTAIDGTRSVYTFATGAASVNMAKKYATKLTGEDNHSDSGCQ